MSTRPLDMGGYTRSRTWRVESTDGTVFVKEAADEGSLYMLRREAAVYRSVRGAFLPALVGFADRGERALLAIEYLEDAVWPPPYPDDVGPLFAALDLVAAATPPGEIPSQPPRASLWRRVEDDPEPFLGLGLCSRAWLERSLDALVAAEAEADLTGDALVHNDVYSANVAFTGRGAMLVDWGAAVRGSRWIDVSLALLSVRVEGGTPPESALPDAHAFAATWAGHFAVEAPAPLPAWAEPGSTLREDMKGDLAHALDWCVEALELPPLG
ncbi:MAG: phosphotransferase [Gaiellaceae bacterium]